MEWLRRRRLLGLLHYEVQARRQGHALLAVIDLQVLQARRRRQAWRRPEADRHCGRELLVRAHILGLKHVLINNGGGLLDLLLRHSKRRGLRRRRLGGDLLVLGSLALCARQQRDEPCGLGWRSRCRLLLLGGLVLGAALRNDGPQLLVAAAVELALAAARRGRSLVLVDRQAPRHTHCAEGLGPDGLLPSACRHHVHLPGAGA
mmetsp:Transcript_55118/g.159566  ORF Transcript_55118/g.159566 Transcript_55118/m.159566 type:complete len:204 (+) Transcript_55118:592-1203(+)